MEGTQDLESKLSRVKPKAVTRLRSKIYAEQYVRPLNQIKQFIKRQRVKSNVQSVNQSSILVKTSKNLAHHPKADS
jgi:hypothetical protein